MVDTPKEGNDDDKEDPVEDKPPETHPKRRRQRHRSKSHHGKDSNTGTRDNNTPDDAEDKEDPVEPTFEQDDREDGQVIPDEQAVNEDSEDRNYLHSPRTRVASATKNLSYLRNLSIRSALSAG